MKSRRTKIIFLVLWLVILAVGYKVGDGVLKTSIELVEAYALTDKDGVPTTEIEHITFTEKDAAIPLEMAKTKAIRFFQVTYASLSLSSFLFAFLVSRRMTVFGDDDIQREHRLSNRRIANLLLAVLTIVIAGYCLHLGLQNPLQGAEKLYGQPTIYMIGTQLDLWSFEHLRTSPFIWPSFVWVGCCVVLVVFYGTPNKGSSRGFRGILSYTENLLKEMYFSNNSGLFGRLVSMDSSDKFINSINLIQYGLFFIAALLGFVFLLLTGSGISNGSTWLEIPKPLLFIGIAGLATQIIKMYDGSRKEEQFARLGVLIGGLGVLAMMLFLLVLLRDLGMVLVVGFVVFLITFSTYFRRGVIIVGASLYATVFLVKNLVIPHLTLDKERIADWALSDKFVTSGLGESFVQGTASSTDFARGLWGIAAGGWTGRGTGLYVHGDTVASAAFFYNDRSGSAVIEIFGWLGLIVIMIAYVVFIVCCLRLYKTKQRRYLARFGLSFGLAALFFGQVVVHFGGNYGFIPFTGLVLPFISHGGIAYTMYLLLITVTVALYLPTDSARDGEVVVEQKDMLGMQWLVYGTILVVIGYGGFETLIKGHQYSTRIRYDIQADNSIKKVNNPRLFLLTDRMDTQAQIVDETYDPENPDTFVSAMIKDEDGNFVYNPEKYKGFISKSNFEKYAPSDYFIHRFERKHAFTLKGLAEQPFKDHKIYNKSCVLREGEYPQFAGRTELDAENRVELFKSRFDDVDLTSVVNDIEGVFSCSVAQVKKGELWKEKVMGKPVNPNDFSKGCKLDNGEVYEPYIDGEDGAKMFNPEHNVWFFNLPGYSKNEALNKLTPYMTHSQKNDILLRAQSPEDVAENSSNYCVVGTWRLKTEERIGVKSGDACVVSDYNGKETSYTTNHINGKRVKWGGARRISIEDYVAPIEPAEVVEETESSEVTDADGEQVAASVATEEAPIENQCVAKIEQVGCFIDGDVYIANHDLDLESRVESSRIAYGTEHTVGFADTSCKYITENLGHLKKFSLKDSTSDNETISNRESYFKTVGIRYLTSKYESDIVSLHKFIKSDLKSQQKYLADFEAKLAENNPETVVVYGMNPALQMGIRKIVEDARRATDAPSAQALVFNVETGEILAQAQATRPREENKKYMYDENGQEKAVQDIDYRSLFLDYGMYGYGRNNLKSAMVPGSTFKILHGLAAIEGGFSDFTHTCKKEGYLPDDLPKDDPWEKPILDFGNHNGRHGRNRTENTLNLTKAITESCNQYFSALAHEHTHPEILTKLCEEKGIKFGRTGKCELREPNTRGGASNGYGQELDMDLYQLAAMLQATSTNRKPYLEEWDTYMEPHQRKENTVEKVIAYFKDKQNYLFYNDAAELEKILLGMGKQSQAKDLSGKGVKVYGKTGTGDQLLNTRIHRVERNSPYIDKEENVWIDEKMTDIWVEDYEKPYGVTGHRSDIKKNDEIKLFVALVEVSDPKTLNTVSRKRIGIVARIPRGDKEGSTGVVAAYQIVKPIVILLRDQELLPGQRSENTTE